MQQQASSLKDMRSMRWHPLMIRWCLYFQHLSGSASELIRESGIIKSPSQRTLIKGLHIIISPKLKQVSLLMWMSTG